MDRFGIHKYMIPAEAREIKTRGKFPVSRWARPTCFARPQFVRLTKRLD